MSSPEPNRHFSAVQLTPGRTYRVIAEFKDYDGHTHSVGDTWTHTSHEFLPYDDGLTLRVVRNGTNSSIRLQWRDEAQGYIVSNFSEFVEEK